MLFVVKLLVNIVRLRTLIKLQNAFVLVTSPCSRYRRPLRCARWGRSSGGGSI